VGSLAIWRDYFVASTTIGVDITDKVICGRSYGQARFTWVEDLGAGYLPAYGGRQPAPKCSGVGLGRQLLNDVQALDPTFDRMKGNAMVWRRSTHI
jgi:hypothetical protein